LKVLGLDVAMQTVDVHLWLGSNSMAEEIVMGVLKE